MAGEPTEGRLGLLEVSDDGGLNYVPVEGLTDIDPSFELEELDTSHHGTEGGHRTFIPGMDSATMSISGHNIDGDPGQKKLRISLVGKMRLDFIWYPEKTVVGSGALKISGKLFPTSLDWSTPQDGVTSFGGSLRLSGATFSEQ